MKDAINLGAVGNFADTNPQKRRKIMAEAKKNELLEVAVIVPFPAFEGKRTSTDKRCFDGREKDQVDDKGKVKKGATIKTSHKVRIDLPVPTTDEESMKMYGIDIFSALCAGYTQIAYDLNKTDAYLETIGTKDVDVDGLTALVEADMPKQERVKRGTETKKKAQAYDALKSRLGISSDEEMEKLIAHAQKMQAGKGKK